MNDAGYWERVAANWSEVRAPLRPSWEDLAIVRGVAASLEPGGAGASLVLGATPELHDVLREIGAGVVMAVDRSEAMLARVWPRSPHTAVRGDWGALPFAAGSCSLVVSDGGWHLLALSAQQRLASELARVSAPGGACVIRLFVPPERREAPEAVLRDLLAGQVPSPDLLKFRLWMALADDRTGEVALADVWDAVAAAAPDLDALADAIGWDRAVLRGFTSYRGAPERYTLRTVDEVCGQLCAGGAFDVCSVHTPTYPMGAQCPTVVVRRRAGDDPR